jgi:hypothetical protein
MWPVPDMLMSPPPDPAPLRVTSTSIDWLGSIRRGAWKHSPVLLKFWVNKVMGLGSTLPPTALKRRGNQALHRG